MEKLNKYIFADTQALLEKKVRRFHGCIHGIHLIPTTVIFKVGGIPLLDVGVWMAVSSKIDLLRLGRR